mgnify:CR=1 FL=1
MATEFRILGEMQVVQSGQPRDLGSLRQRGLLARLIVRAGQPASADHLIDELWPDEVPGKARHTLHVYVSRIRASLGDDRDRLLSDTSGYRLQLEPDEVDASRFERRSAEGRAAYDDGRAADAAETLAAALSLWRGPALVEFADESFAATEATRLDQLRLTALEDRVWADLACGRYAELTEELRGLTLEQPYREVFWEQRMLALYRAGRQAEALHVFAEARTRLADELGIEPGPALRRMEQRVLNQDPELTPGASERPPASVVPSAPPSNLPLQRTTFVGRERDLAIAGELLLASRLLTLTGAPGAGKTRMALRLASDHRASFPDGTLFVSLAGVADAQRLGTTVATALDTLLGREPTPADRDDGLLQGLSGRRLLLVLDNLEQLGGDVGPISRLVDEAPGSTILATSRAPLGLVGEQEVPVLPLAVPPEGAATDPARLSAYDSVALLLTRVRAFDPVFEVTTANAEAVSGIVRRLDGLPLAIELGASRLRLLTPQDLLARLEHRLPLLTAGTKDTVARHQTLRDAIAWSYELLEPAEQHLFRCLGIFVGGFTAKAAAGVARLTLDAAWAGIESLLAQSLLHRPVDTGEARFTMLQTLREFALEQLDAAGELKGVRDGHAHYYLLMAEATVDEEAGDSADVSATGLAPEIDNVRAALQRCAQGGDRRAGLRLAAVGWRAWQAAGRLTEGREWLELLLAEPGPEPTLRAEALTALAGMAYWQADYDQAASSYQEALDLFRGLGERTREAEVLNGLSMTATWRGDPREGGRLAAEARELYEQLGLRDKVGETLMAEGFALWQDGQFKAARPLWEEALAISRELGADTLAVTQLAGLAGIAHDTGAHEAAARIALDALDQACDLDNIGHCVWLLDLTAAFVVGADPAGAVRLAGAADALRRASGGGMRVEDLHIKPARAAAAGSLSPVEIEQAWNTGRSLDLREAMELARSFRPESVG